MEEILEHAPQLAVIWLIVRMTASADAKILTEFNRISLAQTLC
jgi:hypothetical protein